MEYQEKKFILPALEGISKESVDAHLGLYAGYVKNFNAMTALAGDLMKDSDPSTPLGAGKNAHAIAELMRRRSFEFGGMRLHEYYFAQWEGGATAFTKDGPLYAAIAAQYGNPDYCLMEIRHVGMMRGPGWALLYWDPEAKQFLAGFSGEQHQGHFVTLPIIVALDVWEHAYLADYGAAGKTKYIDAFFKNLNWAVMEERFATAK
jgi:Fe-Mn family superoxide dismutase